MTAILLSLAIALGQVGSVAIGGSANYANPSHGPEYLAMRLPRGTVVTITGAGGTWTTAVTDYGPVEATGDIADIALVQFARICGWTVAEARQRGECFVQVEYGSVPLPATDVASWWSWPGGGPR